MDLRNVVKIFALFLVLMTLSVDGGSKKTGKKQARSLRVSGKCKPHILAEYALTFVAEWSPQVFPKMYPRYRPAAQWSQLIGRTHSSYYTMWSPDVLATSAARKFVEDGDASGFDDVAQGYQGIRDAFSAAPIRNGLGQTSTNILADGRHAKVSLMVKMVPSPDWFVGVSALDLCERGRWRKLVEVDLFPMDLGTDEGLTFTSPNWPAYPTELPFRLSPTKPNHPASSFYYPEVEELPRIGKLQLRKVSEYKRKGKKAPDLDRDGHVMIFNDDGETIRIDSEQILAELGRQVNQELPSTQNDNAAPDVSTDIGSEVAVEPCLVSEWAPWSACSKTCGYGQQERRRSILRRASDSRQNCPTLRESRTCGSMRNCRREAFQFLKRKG